MSENPVHASWREGENASVRATQKCRSWLQGAADSRSPDKFPFGLCVDRAPRLCGLARWMPQLLSLHSLRSQVRKKESSCLWCSPRKALSGHPWFCWVMWRSLNQSSLPGQYNMPVDWDGAPPGFQGLIHGKGRIPKEKLLFPEGEGTGKQLIPNSLPFPPPRKIISSMNLGAMKDKN